MLVKQAAEMINNGEVEPNRISKTVLVIDEAQDMSKDDYALVSALMKANEEMRVIAVGDDDQNIYEFRGSNSQYLYELAQTEHSRFIEMTENYRSLRHIVDTANDFARNIRQRIKSTPIISHEVRRWRGKNREASIRDSGEKGLYVSTYPRRCYAIPLGK